MLFTSVAVLVVSVFSAALSAGHIAALFAMQFAVVLNVIFLVLRYPTTGGRGFSMDNPLVSVSFNVITAIIVLFLVTWITAQMSP